MIPYPVDDGRAGAPRIVQVRQAVSEARPEMQQGRSGLPLHARPPVGGAGADALEQSEHHTHSRYAVENLHNRHFGRAGIGKADLDSGVQGGFDQAECSCIHGIFSLLCCARVLLLTPELSISRVGRPPPMHETI